MSRKLTKKEVNSRIKHRGLRMLGDYVNARTKATFGCEHGHTWVTNPANVMGGKGCPHCSGNAPLSSDEINERIAHRGLRMLGDYVNSQTKATFGCDHGHTWEASPNNVTKGHGCPVCATYSFDLTKPAILYSAEVATECGDTVFMIGITNRTFEKRYSREEREKMTLLMTVEYDCGYECQEAEKALKARHRDFLIGPEVKTLLKSKGSQTRSTEIFTKNVTKYHRF